MKKPKSKKPKWRTGWSRALSEVSDKPVTLHRAPWELPAADAEKKGDA